jgi:hypothetical protein
MKAPARASKGSRLMEYHDECHRRERVTVRQLHVVPEIPDHGADTPLGTSQQVEIEEPRRVQDGDPDAGHHRRPQERTVPPQ